MGKNAMVYHNGVRRQRVGDVAGKYETGRIGIGAGAISSPIHFEEIRVEADGVTQFIQDLRPVQPQGKLAIAWGAIRRLDSRPSCSISTIRLLILRLVLSSVRTMR